MTEATLSSKNQIVIPKDARDALGLKAGDKVLVSVRPDKVLILEKPVSYREALKGLSRKGYPAKYLDRERRGWE